MSQFASLTLVVKESNLWPFLSQACREQTSLYTHSLPLEVARSALPNIVRIFCFAVAGEGRVASLVRYIVLNAYATAWSKVIRFPTAYAFLYPA